MVKAQSDGEFSDTMDLSEMTWLVRDFGEAVSSCKITDSSFIIGGWNGKLAQYSHDGDLLWETRWEDRISDIAAKGKTVFATSGLHITATNQKSGKKEWSSALEGSSDALVATEDFVHVVSSVYDIEHYDFLESAVWTFSHSGEEIQVHRVDERPWSIISTKDEILLGMGRPKCGIAKLSQSHEIEIIHDTDSPITCGLNGRAQSLFGMANGNVINQNGEVLMSSQGDSVEAVICTPEGFVASYESGKISSASSSGDHLWEKKLQKITAICDGAHGNENHVFVGSTEGLGGEIYCLSSENGGELAKMSSGKPICGDGGDRWVLIGCEDGRFYAWEAGLLTRRIANNNQQDTDQSDIKRKQSLRDKLRNFKS